MIQLFIDPNRNEAVTIAQTLGSEITKLGYKISYLKPGEICNVNTLLVIAIGGDGTLIRAARTVLDHDVTLAGINCGRLGFLTQFTHETLIQYLPEIIQKNESVSETMLLSIKSSKLNKHQMAINECVIRSRSHRMVRIGTKISRRPGPTIDGDGLIIATPTGSTAHALSAGGPIVDPALDGFVICPLAAHSLAFRPFIVNPESIIEVKSENNDILDLIVDGDLICQINPEETVSITKHKKNLLLAREPGRSFWEVLRNRLKWAQPPNYKTDFN